MHVAFQRDAHPLGTTAVRGHLALGVEHDRVDDVVLTGHACRILLERGEVVEQERSRRDGGQVPGQDLAAPVELTDDGVALTLVDHDRDGGHEQTQKEHRAPQQLGLQRAESEVDRSWAHGARSRRIRRSGM
ncbi:MAG: hypothetical protein AUH30_20055 [Candidatus Rokubacteria bacterium 13_1_40CM_68_15]|nr:MAG: hypothetical protein AUH30_20055 [Candidatus Rokubacteria bacterium 13_1_40CM_68_15]